MEDISTRIAREVSDNLAQRNISLHTIAEDTGMKLTNVKILLKGLAFSNKTAEQFSALYGFNKDYLLRGEGQLLSDQAEIEEEKLFVPKNERLNTIYSIYGYSSLSEFARKLGLSQQRLGGWLHRNTFDAEIVKAAFPDVSGDWLITGEGHPLISQRYPSYKDLERIAHALEEQRSRSVKSEQQVSKMIDILQNIIRSPK